MTRSRSMAPTVLAIWLLAAASAWAAGLFPEPEKRESSKEPIEIVADRLVTNNTEKWADFTGSVKATQGKFSMTSDALRIYYEGDLLKMPKDSPVHDVVKKLVASGKVHIVTEEYVADAERAEYVPATEILTLLGDHSRVVSGKNTLTGSKIVFNRAEGRASVESSGAARVKAVLHQEDKDAGGSDAGKKAPRQ
jgi:lipopolysaccharide transport protein LptA